MSDWDDLLGDLHRTPFLARDSAAARWTVRSPIDGAVLGTVAAAGAEHLAETLAAAAAAFEKWRLVPPPRRGELVRGSARRLRQRDDALAALITLEVGKIPGESRGEVQEMIDVCDFAVGLSRQLYGRTIASERPGHRMMEQWHPLGPVGVITAFNFPAAVWAWNAMLASGLRRSDRLEAVGEGAADGYRLPTDSLAGGGRFRGGAARLVRAVVGRRSRRRPAHRPLRRCCRSSRRRARCAWDARWPRWWRPGWAACCSSLAATTA